MFNDIEKDKIYITFLQNLYLYNIVPLGILIKILKSYDLNYLQKIIESLMIDKCIDILDAELDNIDIDFD